MGEGSETAHSLWQPCAKRAAYGPSPARLIDSTGANGVTTLFASFWVCSPADLIIRWSMLLITAAHGTLAQHRGAYSATRHLHEELLEQQPIAGRADVVDVGLRGLHPLHPLVSRPPCRRPQLLGEAALSER